MPRACRASIQGPTGSIGVGGRSSEPRHARMCGVARDVAGSARRRLDSRDLRPVSCRRKSVVNPNLPARAFLALCLVSVAACGSTVIGNRILNASSLTPVPASASAPGSALPSAPIFAPITLAGSGSKLATFTIPAGQDNFIVRGLAPDGSSTDSLINTIGPYSGTRLFDIDDQHTSAFDVQASGLWTITVEPPASARVWTGASPVSGTGDDVLQLSPTSAAHAVATFSYGGSGAFTVDGFSPSGDDGLVSTIGPFHGQVPLLEGTFLLEVQGVGSWSITLA